MGRAKRAHGTPLREMGGEELVSLHVFSQEGPEGDPLQVWGHHEGWGHHRRGGDPQKNDTQRGGATLAEVGDSCQRTRIKAGSRHDRGQEGFLGVEG